MCGISGFLSNDPGAPANLTAVRRMNDAIRHRGPDAEGVWRHGPCALGHRRLSVIDLSADANQPLCNEDGSVALVGERRDLQLPRAARRARGAGATLPFAERQRGDPASVRAARARLPAHLSRHVRLRAFGCARQPAAARPRPRRQEAALLSPAESGTAFASEMHAVLAAVPEEAPRSTTARSTTYLALQYVPSPRSAYVGIAKLPAATTLSCAPGGAVRVERYWSRPAAGVRNGATRRSSRSELSVIARDRGALPPCFGRPARRVPLGRIDGSMVVALMARRSTARVKTFSIGFPSRRQRAPYARLVAERYGTDHHEIIVDPTMTRRAAPSCDTTASRSPTVGLATYYLARMTQRARDGGALAATAPTRASPGTSDTGPHVSGICTTPFRPSSGRSIAAP